MKKLILLALTYIISISCNEASSSQRSVQEGSEWIVESKSPPIYMVGYTLKLSNVKSHRLRTLEVGKYTYNNINPGDTISL